MIRLGDSPVPRSSPRSRANRHIAGRFSGLQLAARRYSPTEGLRCHICNNTFSTTPSITAWCSSPSRCPGFNQQLFRFVFLPAVAMIRRVKSDCPTSPAKWSSVVVVSWTVASLLSSWSSMASTTARRLRSITCTLVDPCAADRLFDALRIYADLLRRPLLPEDQLEDGRLVCFQEIRAAEDDLPQRAMLQLRERFYGQPDGRDCHGSIPSIQSITEHDVRRFFESGFRPDGTIISVAGKLDWAKLKEHVGNLLADWQTGKPRDVQVDQGERGSLHIPFDSQQTQIALAFDSVPYSHPDYFRAGAPSVS